jgi:hypothetical protein
MIKNDDDFYYELNHIIDNKSLLKYKEYVGKYMDLLGKMGFDAECCYALSPDECYVTCFYIMVNACGKEYELFCSLELYEFFLKFDLLLEVYNFYSKNEHKIGFLPCLSFLSREYDMRYITIKNDIRVLSLISDSDDNSTATDNIIDISKWKK